MQYDKQALLKQLKVRLEHNIERAQQSYERTRQSSSELPSRAESRYDSSRTEMGWLAGGLAENLRTSEEGLGKLANVSLGNGAPTIHIGDVVKVCNRETRGLEEYFILPSGGGEELEVDENNVMVITPLTPLAQALLNKRIGASTYVTVGDKEMEYIIITKQ